MSDLSLVVKNARVVDGTGRPSYLADVGVANERVAVIGRIDAPSANARIIDAEGAVLSPGFIDIHTHYDAQIAWDSNLTPSPDHGVTSVIFGNCSLSMAPITKPYHDMLSKMFYSVEDLSPDLILQNVPFDWESFPEYLDKLRADLGPNVGALVGHTNLRYVVMGADAQTRAATAAEVDRMCGLLKEAIESGAKGLSLTHAHKDISGRPLPSQCADESEFLALCRAMARAGGGVLEDVPPIPTQGHLDLLDQLGRLSLETGVMASYDAIAYSPSRDFLWRQELEKLDEWQHRGARLTAQILVRALDQTFTLGGLQLGLAKLESWKDIMIQPVDKRLAALNDPQRRREMIEEADRVLPHMAGALLIDTADAGNAVQIGRTVGEIAAERGTSPMAAMIELSLADDLRSEFKVTLGASDEIVAEMLRHPLTHPGAADAGAHVAQFAGAGDTCYLLEHFVRDTGHFTLEEGVHLLTGKIANDWDVSGRGRIERGAFADLVLFDPATIARGDEERVSDYPGNMNRWVRKPTGINQVIVNGELLLDRGAYTDAKPGMIL